MRELPSGWKLVELRDVLTSLRNGVFVSRPSAAPPGIPIFRISAVRPFSLNLADVRYVSDSQMPRDVDHWFVNNGDLLFTRYSGNPKFVGCCAMVRSLTVPTLHPDKLIRATVDTTVAEPRYLEYALNTGLSRRAIEQRLKTTAGQVGISGSSLREVPLPLPPLAEQRRIGGMIEEHFSRLDVGEGLLRAASTRLARIRRSVLVAAVPRPLPPTWELITVEDAGEVDLGRQRSPKYHSGPNMRPYLRVANVFEDRIDLSDVKEMDFPPEHAERNRLAPGDILLNEGQSPELVGRPAMFRGELREVYFTNSLIRFRPGKRVDGEFALLVFRHHLHSGRFQREARITTNIAHMAAGRFKTVEFPVPPLDQQRRIVAGIQRQLSIIDALAVSLKHALIRSGRVRRAVLDAAFAGQLVPQDSGDDQTSLPLGRISATRVAGDGGPRKEPRVGAVRP
jgi:type I restriction enzyme S subunit